MSVAVDHDCNIAIVGLGLMGGSFALALKQAGWGSVITGIDIQPEVGTEACRRQIIDKAYTSIEEGVATADIVVLATPVRASVDILGHLAELGYPGLVTDLGSTKKDLCETAARYPNLRFVGGHPMAGSEIVGLAGITPNLFHTARVILTPTDRSATADIAYITDVWARLGAHVVQMDPDEHDQIAAIISHLPYAAAVATMNACLKLAQNKHEAFACAAGGLRDTTRIAGGDPVMWRDIFLTNSGNVVKAIQQLICELREIERAITCRDQHGVIDILTQGQRARRQYLSR